MDTHKWTAFSASISQISAAMTLLLQLAGVRFAIEVGLRLAGDPKPSSTSD
ncbi:hypothetical protein [Mesorhizobium sp. B1-1-7]|nr:hypothetical protein [Mesorhizobium sp. B1-1-7]